jgi:hypothetical protein
MELLKSNCNMPRFRETPTVKQTEQQKNCVKAKEIEREIEIGRDAVKDSRDMSRFCRHYAKIIDLLSQKETEIV